jgi:hypothetical protein
VKNALAVVLMVAALGVPTLAGAVATQDYRFTASMTAKQVTKPRPPQGNVGDARGSLVGTTTAGKPNNASWTLTFSGMTGQVKVAEVRYPAGGLVSVIRLCAPCANGAKLTTTFPSRVFAQAFIKQALAGKADVVLTTKRNPGGEVRGVLKARSA